MNDPTTARKAPCGGREGEKVDSGGRKKRGKKKRRGWRRRRERRSGRRRWRRRGEGRELLILKVCSTLHQNKCVESAMQLYVE